VPAEIGAPDSYALVILYPSAVFFFHNLTKNHCRTFARSSLWNTFSLSRCRWG